MIFEVCKSRAFKHIALSLRTSEIGEEISYSTLSNIDLWRLSHQNHMIALLWVVQVYCSKVPQRSRHVKHLMKSGKMVQEPSISELCILEAIRLSYQICLDLIFFAKLGGLPVFQSYFSKAINFRDRKYK